MYRYYTTSGTTNTYKTDCTGYVTANSYTQNWIHDYVKHKNTKKTISEDEIMKILKD
jgi:hypothetical protein